MRLNHCCWEKLSDCPKRGIEPKISGLTYQRSNNWAIGTPGLGSQKYIHIPNIAYITVAQRGISNPKRRVRYLAIIGRVFLKTPPPPPLLPTPYFLLSCNVLITFNNISLGCVAKLFCIWDTWYLKNIPTNIFRSRTSLSLGRSELCL